MTYKNPVLDLLALNPERGWAMMRPQLGETFVATVYDHRGLVLGRSEPQTSVAAAMSWADRTYPPKSGEGKRVDVRGEFLSAYPGERQPRHGGRSLAYREFGRWTRE